MTEHDHVEEHDLGLAHDLQVIRQITDRRRALQFFGGASLAALVGACSGSDGSSTTATTTSTASAATPTATATTTVTATPTPTPTATATSTTTACIVDPTETAGPFPADGTNTASGATSNVLLQSGIVRSDIRSSFIGSSTAVAAGVLVTITLTVVNARSSCAPLSGYLVYLWHCNRDGLYSLYDLPAESYLRGAQVTNAAGQVTFTTIFPACYSGRYPHMHFEVFASASAATSGRTAILTSQFAMPAAICNAVFATTGYATSQSRFAQTSLSGDNVFGDNTAAQIAAQTPAFVGSPTAGYAATATIGVSV